MGRDLFFLLTIAPESVGNIFYYLFRRHVVDSCPPQQHWKKACRKYMKILEIYLRDLSAILSRHSCYKPYTEFEFVTRVAWNLGVMSTFWVYNRNVKCGSIVFISTEFCIVFLLNEKTYNSL